MTTLRQRLWATIELSRLSNVPTIISNTLVGCALSTSPPPPIAPTVAAVAAVSLLYVGGMAFNDVADVAWDRVHRSSRPIPDGRLSRRAATVIGTIALGTGFVICALHGAAPAIVCAALIVSTLAYDFTHKRFSAAIVLMGLCRGLVYPLAAAMIAWPIDPSRVAWPAVIVAVYTILLTAVARREHATPAGRIRPLAWFLPLLPLALILVFQPAQWFWTTTAAALSVLWIGHGTSVLRGTPPRTRQAVLTWLSAFCLIDTLILALIDQPALAPITLACFALTLVAHRYVSGT